MKKRVLLPSQEELRLLFDYEDGKMIHLTSGKAHKAGQEAGTINTDGYRKMRIAGQGYAAHRIVWKWHYGTEPPKYIDHINSDKLDNRIENLQACSARQNMVKELSPTRLPLGVSQERSGRYTARYSINGERRHIGTYDTPEQARRAYLEATL